MDTAPSTQIHRHNQACIDTTKRYIHTKKPYSRTTEPYTTQRNRTSTQPNRTLHNETYIHTTKPYARLLVLLAVDLLCELEAVAVPVCYY
jgi:hypothetical protein